MSTWCKYDKGSFDTDANKTESYTNYWHDDIECKIRGIAVDEIEADVVESERYDDSDPHSHTEYTCFWEKG